MQPTNQHPLTDRLILGLLALFLLFIVLMIPAGIHGYYRDHFGGGLDEDCWMCDLYRFHHRDDVAFQLREVNRKERD